MSFKYNNNPIIVIFNGGTKDIQILTDNHGFIKEFYNSKDAQEEADKWIDGTQYRDYQLYQEHE